MANTIRHKRSSTTGATPAAGSLVTGELAVNTADGKLFTKKDSGTVVEIGGTPAGSTSQVQFNSSGVFAADDGLTFTSASETLRVGSGANHLKLYSDAYQTFVEPVGGALRLRHPSGGYITIGDASATGSIGTGTNILVSANDASITNYAQLVWNRAPVLTEGVATFQANVNLQASLLLNNSQGTNGQVLTSTGSGVQWATPSSGGGSSFISRTQFDSSSTYTIPTNTRLLRIFAVGGGGGGGGGYRRASAGSGGGGGGGMPAQSALIEINASFFGGAGVVLGITIGAAGTGGAGGATDNSNGSAGTAGGDTIITWNASGNTFLKCLGGPKGNGGTAFAGGTADSGRGHYFYPTLQPLSTAAGSGGGYGSTVSAVASQTGSPVYCFGTGGAGVAAAADYAAGAVVNYFFWSTTVPMVAKDLPASSTTGIIINGGVAGGNGGNASANVTDLMSIGLPGSGGGSGYNRNAGNGGNGYRGAGGGGGGASNSSGTGYAAGNGGNGGNGYVCIEAYA
jgi:hypothetical protein